MIHQLRTFWVVQTSAELVNLLAVFLSGFCEGYKIVAVVVSIEREILHIDCVMFMAAMQAEMP